MIEADTLVKKIHTLIYKFSAVLTSILLTAALAVTSLSSPVSAIFTKEDTESAATSGRYYSSEKSSLPSPSPSVSAHPTPSTTTETKNNDTHKKASTPTDDERPLVDITLWLIGGGVLLAALLGGTLWFVKKKK